MHEPNTRCERWQEPVSLLAAGCLPADEQPGVRQHLAVCPACAARFMELTSVCTSLGRSRPPAAPHAAAIRGRWSEDADRVTPRRPPSSLLPRFLWVSATLAVSLLIAVLWLADRQPRRPPTLPQDGQIVDSRSNSGRGATPREIPQPIVVSPPSATADLQLALTQPTLLAYQLALAQSDEAFDALMRRHGESIVFEPYNPQSLWKEAYP